MIDFQEKAAEQLEQYRQLQKDALVSMRARSADAVATYEKLARHNLDVMTDFVDFAVGQAKAATGAVDPAELFGKQVENASAFAKVVENRSRKFADLVTETASRVSRDIEQTTKAAGQKAAGAKAKQAA